MNHFKAVNMDIFKICPKCDTVWKHRKDFLDDAEIDLAGYQVNFKDLKSGLFLFNHISCETTMSIKAELFLDMSRGPIFRERKHGTEECPGYCLYEDNLLACPAQCECEYVRSVLNKIKKVKGVETAIP